MGNIFSKPKCVECGREIGAEPAKYETTIRLYCDECLPLKTLKERWHPMTRSSSVAGVFVISNTPKIAPNPDNFQEPKPERRKAENS